MSRREIRRMLMESKRAPTHHKPWAVSLLMALVLLGGVGLGIGAGYGILSARSERQESRAWEQAEMQVDRPPRRDEMLAAPAANPEPPPEPVPEKFDPLIPVPMPRPGGLADDGFDPEAEDNNGPAVAVRPAMAPPPQLAALPLPAPAPDPGGKPAWVRYAVPSPAIGSRPMIAVVIDDLGVDRKRSERVTTLPAPLTLAWMTYADNLRPITQAARQRGHELMVHVPMQPQSESYDPGPDVLEVGLPTEELRRRLRWGLSRFDGFVGINNHMGSRFTADRAGMNVVMDEIRARGLLFLDSVTTQKSVAPDLARQYGVPFAARHVFLDNEMTVSAVRGQLAKTEAYARKYGAAIAIGHPHDGTIEALAGWLPGLEAKGFVLVPVTTIVKRELGR
ncbi:divergent polysaccharide deacetylase family protein [Magnetospirillum gryphiswaldense]|uniref:divergent polysaccharide deacetylase family protein n=1 Tax=Magnetospirillum gryphiswaldense TaxID=55518 RepID=UPI0005A036DA|nr:divergent polysaccharide deacetylase family protein [Magnetospirillum gryphiswaldense]AVM73877.1 divergent polysaccharide deacetylase [Magnetospirillum gryphiswaldense MSR-1]AVM77780.1 divergent polysaccharide deacetylase [Magnetospirillum gryphiswaldense]